METTASAAQVAATTAWEQGLPAQVTDPAALGQIARILLNAREAAATNGDLSNHEPGVARTPQGTPRSGVRRAA